MRASEGRGVRCSQHAIVFHRPLVFIEHGERHMRSSVVYLLLLCVVPCITSASVQEIPKGKIYGRVIDDSTHAPIVNANVFIANSMIGTSSDTSGYFEIKNVPVGFHELVASCVGYFMSTIKIQLIAAGDEKVEMHLKPRDVRLGVVEVTAPQPEAWKENLKTFTKLLLGSTPEASECRIINPEVLDFSADPFGRFQARADKEVTIDNLALGYRLHLSLGTFSLEGRWLSSAWKVRYEEVQSLDPDVRSRWQKNRDEVYSGSLHHFFVALVSGDLADDGFNMYNSETLNRIRRDAPLLEFKRRDIVRQSTLNEWVVRFHNFLVVTYDRKQIEMEPGQAYPDWRGRFPDANPRRRRTRPQISILALTKDSLLVDSRGQMLDHLALKVSGDWGKEGLARDLPLEFQPKSKR